MSMRVATMSPMTSMDTSASVREPSYLFRKLVLLILLVTAGALWTVLLFKDRTNFPLLLSTFFADASMGLIAGFGSRFVLQKRGWFIHLLAAIVMATFGMLLIGYATDWVLGIGPITLEAKAAEQINRIQLDRTFFDEVRSLTIDPLTFLDFQKMDWADLIHFAISLVMTLMSLYAWRSNNTSSEVQVVEVAPSPGAQPRRATRSTSSSNSSNGRARIRPSGGWLARLRPSLRSGQGIHSNNGIRSTVLREAKKASNSLVRPKRRRSRRKAIEFALTGEHRCPYCLDPVTRNDSRGVKECEVCHTLHHADCWAISGVCQVPHLNT